MNNLQQHDITQLLGEVSEGNKNAVDALMPLVYSGLQQIAQRHLRGERANHTLNTTALVHEAYMKLVDQSRVTWQNRAHFYDISSQALSRILINYAESRNAQKRGGGQPIATFNEEAYQKEARADDLLALDEALTRLEKLNERQSRIVEFRFFGGLTQEEIAEALGVSVATVRLDWRMARAWLSRELSQQPPV